MLNCLFLFISGAFIALQNTENVKKAAAQLLGVSGREYRVYFYQTYVSQLSKGKSKSIKMTENESNGNKNNESSDKRKRNTPPKNVSTNDNGNDLKKVKSE